MKTVLILAASLLIASAVLVISLRILQWVVTAICGILSAAIDLFREIKTSVTAVNTRLSHLCRFVYKVSCLIRRRTKARTRRILYRATPRICNLLTMMSYVLYQIPPRQYRVRHPPPARLHPRKPYRRPRIIKNGNLRHIKGLCHLNRIISYKFIRCTDTSPSTIGKKSWRLHI